MSAWGVWRSSRTWHGIVTLAVLCGSVLGADAAGVVVDRASPLQVDASATGRVTEPVSVNSEGEEADGDSLGYAVSAHGRFVAFSSAAANLVSHDTNGDWDVFVRDRLNDTTERVSVSTSGSQGGGESQVADISANGRYVLFDSTAPNLVTGDTNGERDVFVRDRFRGTTVRVSVSTGRGQGSRASYGGSISDDGRVVAFVSSAPELVGHDTNRCTDVFVRNRSTRRTVRVSVSSHGVQGDRESFEPVVSGNGRWVAFTSYARNLTPGDGGGLRGLYLRDRVGARTTAIAALDSDSGYFAADLSTNGRHVVYLENWYASAYYVNYRDLTKRRAQQIAHSAGSMPMWSPEISGTGRYVVYGKGRAGDHATGALFDRRDGTTTPVTISTTGAVIRRATPPAISADGNWIVFASASSAVVPSDTNNASDVFIRHR